MAHRDWKSLGPVAAAWLLAGTLAAAVPAAAGDWPDHDRRIEQWAAQQISGKLGDLRGSFGHEIDLDKATVHQTFAQPKPKLKPATRIFVLPKTGESLPPVVSNGVLPPGVDPVMTGTTKSLPPGVDPIVTGTAKTLPPGVDPIVTGSNSQPTGAAGNFSAANPPEPAHAQQLNNKLFVN